MLSSMDRRRFLGALGASALAGAQTTKKTNVVMVMTDDHGAWALGSYGCGEMKTPNIDALAAGGAKFTASAVGTARAHRGSAIADFDQDGKPDILVSSRDQRVTTFLSKGARTSFVKEKEPVIVEEILAILPEHQ